MRGSLLLSIRRAVLLRELARIASRRFAVLVDGLQAALRSLHRQITLAIARRRYTVLPGEAA